MTFPKVHLVILCGHVNFVCNWSGHINSVISTTKDIGKSWTWFKLHDIPNGNVTDCYWPRDESWKIGIFPVTILNGAPLTQSGVVVGPLHARAVVLLHHFREIGLHFENLEKFGAFLFYEMFFPLFLCFKLLITTIFYFSSTLKSVYEKLSEIRGKFWNCSHAISLVKISKQFVKITDMYK
jgi:hypothetical protein